MREKRIQYFSIICKIKIWFYMRYFEPGKNGNCFFSLFKEKLLKVSHFSSSLTAQGIIWHIKILIQGERAPLKHSAILCIYFADRVLCQILELIFFSGNFFFGGGGDLFWEEVEKKVGWVKNKNWGGMQPLIIKLRSLGFPTPSESTDGLH